MIVGKKPEHKVIFVDHNPNYLPDANEDNSMRHILVISLTFFRKHLKW